MTDVISAVNASSLNTVLNNVFMSDFGSATNASVASTLVTNLGLTGTAATEAQAYIVGVLGGTAANAMGAAIMTILNQFAGMTSDATFGAAATAWESKVTNAVNYSQNTANTVNESISAITSSAVGKTYTLTTGVDSLTGTSSNDTFIADNTGTSKVLSVADTINGNGGNDTLKVYLAAADTGFSYTASNITNVQNLYENGGAALSQDFSAGSFTSITLDSTATTAANTVTLKGSAQSITIENIGGSTANAFDLKYQSADTTANVTLKQVGTAAAQALDINAGANVATLNLTSSGTTNNVNLSNTAAGLTTLNLSGAGATTVTVSTAGLSAALKTITASSTTGALSVVDIAGTVPASFAFTGGSGGDSLEITKASLEALTAGSQLNGGTGATNTLNISAPGTFASADYTALNATTNFNVLELTSTAAVIVNASSITAGFAKHFADNVSGAGVALTISNMADASTVDMLSTDVTATFGGVVGAHTLTLNVGNSSTATGLTEGATGKVTATGWSTIDLTSNAKAATTVNTISLANSDNTTIDVSGSAGLTIAAISAATATGDSIDASALTGAFTLSATSGKGDIIKTGSGTTSITDTASATGNTVTLLSGHTKVDTINTSADWNPASAYSSATALTNAIDKISNFNTGATASDILKMGGTAAVGVTADLGGTWTVTKGIATTTGTNTATAFIAAVQAATGTASDVVAYSDGTNTYVANFDGSAGKAYIVELVGVHSATAVSTSAGANTIHIA
jgi:hypothetical protein